MPRPQIGGYGNGLVRREHHLIEAVEKSEAIEQIERIR